MEERRGIKMNVANCFYKHLGKKPVEITAQTDFSIPFISLSENKKELGEREMVICGYLFLWTFAEEQLA